MIVPVRDQVADLYVLQFAYHIRKLAVFLFSGKAFYVETHFTHFTLGSLDWSLIETSTNKQNYASLLIPLSNTTGIMNASYNVRRGTLMSPV